MRFSILGGLLGVALVVSAGSVFANSGIVEVPQNKAQAVNQNEPNSPTRDQVYQNQTYSDQQAGEVGSDASLKDNIQAKKMIAPQSVMLQASLMSAKTQLEGLKNQISYSETGKFDSNFLNQIKTYDRSIDSTIKDAASRESSIKATLEKNYPQIASLSNTKELESSVKDLQAYFNSWSNKAKSRGYWKDRDQASADLDSLDKRIDKALNHSRTFNSEQLEISIG